MKDAKKTSPSSGSDETSENVNRSPAEINAATDLVGIGTKSEETDDKPSVVDDCKDGSSDGAASASASASASADGGPTKKDADADEGEDIDEEAAPQGQGQCQDAVPSKPKGAGSGSTDNDPASADAIISMANDIEGTEGEKTAFPILLHEIVTDPSTDDCIHWLQCGTRFMISDKKKFADEVLTRFYGHAKFTSFTRRLKRWSFTRVPSGPFMGSYYNANFRRGEPELAARVRYDHPIPLSGSAIQLSKQQLKLQAQAAAGGVAMGLGGPGGMFGANPLMGGGQMQQMSNEDREMLLRQMNLVNGAGNMMGMGMGIGMGGPGGIDSLYRAMGQNNPLMVPSQANLAAMNNSVMLQMAMAQEAMQQRQQQHSQLGQMDQARLMAQQQLQQQWNNPNMSMLNPAQGKQGQGGQTPEDQRMLAAMFLEHLNKQQQQQQQQQLLPGQTNPNLQLQSSGFNFGGQGGGGGGGGPMGQVSSDTSGGSLSNNQQQGPPRASMNILQGGGGPSSSNNWGNTNSSFNSSPGQLGPTSAMGQAGGGGGVGGGPSGNPMAMSAFLADYLRRNGGPPPNGEGGGGGGGGGGGNVIKEEGGDRTEAFC
ncbi:hypothetical protein ACHAW5_000262 [Stephanodiscus triporus]|uniref:HSF-type DNA-binding domain-containing protein n=1 Tax=Stephanodiscus triporus TaxID=2934178 RepID=A0ABD3Q0Q1_9STRA